MREAVDVSELLGACCWGTGGCSGGSDEGHSCGHPAGSTVVIDPRVYAQALIDQADREVRRVAKKAGVPDHAMARAVRDFARELVPHAGRQASVHSPSHWKRWWRGYAAGMRAMADRVDASIETPDPFEEAKRPPGRHPMTPASPADMRTEDGPWKVPEGWLPAIGDTVSLKGGDDPRVMTVFGPREDDGRVHCTWKSSSGSTMHDWFDPAGLEPA